MLDNVHNLNLPAVRLLRLDEVMKITGLGRSSIYAYIKAGKFPPQLNVSKRCARWYASDVEHWLSETVKQLDQSIKAGADWFIPPQHRNKLDQ